MPHSLTEALLATHPDYNARDMVLHTALMSSEVNLADKKLGLLVQGRNEGDEDFKFRCRITPWAPQSPAIESAFLGALLQKRPMLKGKRELSDAQMTTNWRTDMYRSMLRYGRCALLLDRPTVAGERTMADIQAEEDNESVFVYAGPSVLDWRRDENENLVMLKTIEVFDARTSWDDPNPDARQAKKVFIWEMIGDSPTLRTFTIIGQDVAETTASAQQPNAAFGNRLPVELIESESLIGRIADLDIDSIRILSDLRYDMYQHTHPMLRVYSPDPKEWAKKGVKLGASEVIGLKRESLGDVTIDEDMSYLAVPSNVIQDHELRYKRTIEEIYKIAGILRQNAEQFASGVSVQFRFAIGQEKMLQEYVTLAERAERNLMELAGAGTITYNRNFALDPMAETQVTDAQVDFAKGLPTFQRVLMEQYVNKHIPENISPKDRRAIMKELAEWEPQQSVFGALGLEGSPVDDSGSESDKDPEERGTPKDEKDPKSNQAGA